MQEDKIFDIEDTLYRNLEYILENQGVGVEQRAVELTEIANAVAEQSVPLLKSGYALRDVISILSDSLELGNYDKDCLFKEDAALVCHYNTLVKSFDKAYLSSLILSALRRRGYYMAEGDFLVPTDAKESFVYVRNTFSDEAFDVFSEGFENPRVIYAESFKECVNALNDGRATFCLLPLEERGSVRLAGVSELILKEDLKINAVSSVFGLDGNADMKYALLSNGFINWEAQGEDDRYLELRIMDKSSLELSEILDAVKLFGHILFRIDTVCGTLNETEKFYSLVIRDGGRGFCDLLTYLTIFSDGFVPVGLYKNLE